jgi:hypothetical protein
MKIRTWAIEMAIVGAVLLAVTIATKGGWLELIGACAVLLSFGHAQVANRFAEREGARTVPQVHCYKWATRYLVSKEAFWLIYFVLHQSWSALAGVGLFLAYPMWRRWYRTRKPLQ